VLLWPASFVFPNALRAANDVKFTMIVSIVSMFAVRIGCSYLLAAIFHTGALAVWSAMIADWVVRVTCFVWRYRSGGWKRRAQFTS
jgi:Na+-driven multidrug efflux pump